MSNNWKWELRFMKIADDVAQWSKDQSSKVGAVIIDGNEIVTTGYNGLPRGCDDNVPERHEKPEKYNWFIHAEANAIINAARQGKSTLNKDMYVNWFPCDQCAGFIVNAGIKTIYCDKEPDWNHYKWGGAFKRAKKKLDEGGVKIVYLNYDAHRQ